MSPGLVVVSQAEPRNRWHKSTTQLLPFLAQPQQRGKDWRDRRHLSSVSEGDDRLGLAEGHRMHGRPHRDVSCSSACCRDDCSDAAGAAVPHLERCAAHHRLHSHQGEPAALPPAASPTASLQGCFRIAVVLQRTFLFMSVCPYINLSVVWLPANGWPSPLTPCSFQECSRGIFHCHGNKWGICSRSASICTGLPRTHRSLPADPGAV